MRKALLLLPVCGLLTAAALYFRSDAGPAFATPLDCVEAYLRALKSADEASYLHCLDDRLQAAVRRQHIAAGTLAQDLQAQGRDLRNWVVLGEEPAGGDEVAVLVDQQFSGGRRRQKLVLGRAGSTWRIARLEAPRDLPQEVPYGTHISKVAGGNGPERLEEPEPEP